jgi:hypothetical protein
MKLCQEKRESQLSKAKLTKGKLKAHLSRRYKGKIAERIIQAFSAFLEVPVEFGAWIDILETLLNYK